MAGKDPEEAVRNYVAPIRRLIGAFVPGAEVVANSYDPDTEGILRIAPSPAPLSMAKRGQGKLSFSAAQRYRIVEDDHPDRGPWKVTITEWIYTLKRSGRDYAGFHYHPRVTPHIDFAHFHGYEVDEFRNRHIPTGRVLIEDALRFAMELGAQPMVKRIDKLFVRNREGFHRGATWGHGPVS